MIIHYHIKTKDITTLQKTLYINISTFVIKLKKKKKKKKIRFYLFIVISMGAFFFSCSTKNK